MKKKYEKRLRALNRKKRREEIGRRSLIRIRNVSLGVLFIVLLFLVVLLIRNLFLDGRSRSRMAELQKYVSADNRKNGTEELIPTEEEKPVGNKTEKETEAVPEVRRREEGRLLQYQLLYQENNDLCGWLRIPDTVIDYPVMHRENDNDFYLAHDFSKEEDVNGLLVLDKRCDPNGTDANLLIHGHNMRSGFMFGSLKEYKDPAYFEAHPTIWYDTLYHEYTYRITAVFLSSVGEERDKDFDFYDYINIDTEEEFYAYVNGAREASLYDTRLTPVYGDQLLTLSTCDYSKEDGRLVIVAFRHPG